jgi:hypothetical protein
VGLFIDYYFGNIIDASRCLSLLLLMIVHVLISATSLIGLFHEGIQFLKLEHKNVNAFVGSVPTRSGYLGS